MVDSLISITSTERLEAASEAAVHSTLLEQGSLNPECKANARLAVAATCE